MLSPDSPEAQRGFLLNHVISEWLPAQDRPRFANADPVTGQAAWYDLRVKVDEMRAGGDRRDRPAPDVAETPPNMPHRHPALQRRGSRS
jgi:sulfite dehydrogenase (quinone) subunit SoeA